MNSLALVALCALLAGASAQLDLPSGPSTVAEAAAATAETSVLAAAVDAAGLTGALSGEGPFTVFAPTNDAFAAAVEALNTTLDDLLNDQDALAEVLLYHVVPGLYLSSDLEDSQELITLQGQPLTISINASGVMINDAEVISVDMEAGNGVVHLINAVLLPPAKPAELATVVDVAIATPATSTLAAAVTVADLVDALSTEGPFTVFAPTNDAFAAAVAALNTTAEELLADTATLTDVLLYHVVPGLYLSSDLKDGQELTSLEGQPLTISVNASGVMINGADVISADVQAGNGVVHVINAVLLPLEVTDDTPGASDTALGDDSSSSTLFLSAAAAGACLLLSVAA